MTPFLTSALKRHTPLFFSASVYLLIGLLYWSTSSGLVSLWLEADGSLSHGLLVLLLSIHLSAKSISANTTSKEPSRSWTLFCLSTAALFSIVWFLAASTSIDIIEQLALIPLLFATLSYLSMNKPSAFLTAAVCFLIFAIPVWDYLTQALVDLSSIAVTWAVERSTIPALIDGNVITLAYGSLIIADGCSGLRYLTISLALATFVIIDSERKTGRFFALFISAIIIGLLSNWIRIFLLILIAHQSNMTSSLVKDHELFGWVIFAIALIPLYFIARSLSPRKIVPQKLYSGSKRSILSITPILMVITTGPLLSLKSTTNISPLESIIGPTLSKKPPHFLINIPTAKHFNEQAHSDQLSRLDIYNWQTNSNENLVPYWKRTYKHEQWTLIDQASLTIEGKPVTIQTLKRKHVGDTACITIHQSVGGYSATNYIHAKLLQVLAKLYGDNYYIANVIYTVTDKGSCEDLRDSLLKATLNSITNSHSLLNNTLSD